MPERILCFMKQEKIDGKKKAFFLILNNSQVAYLVELDPLYLSGKTVRR